MIILARAAGIDPEPADSSSGPSSQVSYPTLDRQATTGDHDRLRHRLPAPGETFPAFEHAHPITEHDFGVGFHAAGGEERVVAKQ